MVYIPLIFFTCLLLYFWKKSGSWTVDVAATSILVLISVCAIVIDAKNLYGEYGINEYSYNPLGLFLYCFQWTVVLFAFYYIAKCTIAPFPENKFFLYKIFTLVALGCLLLLLYYQHTDIAEALTSDISEVRSNHYENLENGTQAEGRNILMYLPIVFSTPPMTSVFLLLWFYCFTFVHHGKIWQGIFLLTALLPILLSTMVAGRGSIIYFGIECYLCLCLFWKYLSPKQHRWILIVITILGTIIGTWFMFITLTRFNTSGRNPIDSLYGYAGQHINNFCSFIQYGSNSPFQIGRIFPLTNKLLGNGFTITQHYTPIEHAIGIPVHVFSSFGGELFLDLGISAFLIFLVGWIILVNRNLKKMQSISFAMIFIVGILIAFFSKGLFAWPFIGHYCTGAFICAIVGYILFHYHFKFK